MSDKSLPITLTGSYQGYTVSIQVESTLDNLDKLVGRLKARGIEPLPTPPAGTQPERKSERKGVRAALEGTYVGHHIPARGPACKVSLKLAGNVEREVDFWQAVPSDLISLGSGVKIRVEGTERTSPDGRYVNFAATRWEKINNPL